jgi:hypothetical protein
MARARREKIAIGFMVLWLIIWAGGMMVVLYGLSRAVASGEPMATLFMTLWLGGAGFGLLMGARKLRELLLNPGGLPRRVRGPDWNDGVPPDRNGGGPQAPPPV